MAVTVAVVLAVLVEWRFKGNRSCGDGEDDGGM